MDLPQRYTGAREEKSAIVAADLVAPCQPEYRREVIVSAEDVVSAVVLPRRHDQKLASAAIAVVVATASGILECREASEATEWSCAHVGALDDVQHVLVGDFDADGHEDDVAAVSRSGSRPATLRLFLTDGDRWPSTDLAGSAVASQTFNLTECHGARTVRKTEDEREVGGDNVVLGCREGIRLFNVSLASSPSTWNLLNTVELYKFDGRAANETSGVAALASVAATQPCAFLAATDHDASMTDYDVDAGGDTVSVYLPYDVIDGRSPWATDTDLWEEGARLGRIVLEQRAAGGHAVVTTDVNGDECDDVIVGFRGLPASDRRDVPRGIIIYHCVRGATHLGFTKQVLSEHGSTALLALDVDADEQTDLVSLSWGRNDESGNGSLTLYLNRWRQMGQDTGGGSSFDNNSKPDTAEGLPMRTVVFITAGTGLFVAVITAVATTTILFRRRPAPPGAYNALDR